MKAFIITALSAASLLVASVAAAAGEKDVTVNKRAEHDAVQGAPDKFTGKVEVSSAFKAENPDHYSGALVSFDAGARTAWHTHPLGQTLVVTAGQGLVQSEGHPIQAIQTGDVVWIPANTRHWHGASADSAMSHVAIVDAVGGNRVEWMEHVTDAQYSAREE